MKVGSDSTLTLSRVAFSQSSGQTNSPIINSEEGALHMTGVTFRNFPLFDTPLFAISTKAGCFSMASYKDESGAKRNGDEEEEEELCRFTGITRHGGNGTIFSLTLDSSSDISLENAEFESCSLQHIGSVNAFGGAIYMIVTSESAKYNLQNLYFDGVTSSSNGSFIYAVLPTTPTSTQTTMWEALLELNDEQQSYYDGEFVLEYDDHTTNVYELYPHDFVGSRYYDSSTRNGSYYYPLYSLNSTTASRIYVLYGDTVHYSSSPFSVSADKTLRPVGPKSSGPTYPTVNFDYLSSSYASNASITVNAAATFTVLKIKFKVDGDSYSRSYSTTYNIGSLFNISGTLVLQDVQLSNSTSSLCFTSPAFVLQSGAAVYLIDFEFKSTSTYTSNCIYLEQVPLFQVKGACTLSNTLPSTVEDGISGTPERASLKYFRRTFYSSYSAVTGAAAGIEGALTSGTLEITGLSFNHVYGTDTSSGAIGLAVNGGTASITDCSFESCEGTTDGCACSFIVTGGTLSLSDNTFTSCSSYSGYASGGAVYIHQTGGTIDLGTTAANYFDSCSSSTSSSDYTVGGGALYITTSSGTLNLGSTDKDITTTFSYCSAYGSGSGGAVYLYLNTTSPVINFGRLSFSGCSANYYGSNMFVYVLSDEWTKTAKYSPAWMSLMANAEPIPSYSDYQICYHSTSGNSFEYISALPVDTVTFTINYNVDPDENKQCKEATSTCTTLGSVSTLPNFATPKSIKIQTSYLSSSSSEVIQLTFTHTFATINGTSHTLRLASSQSTSASPCFTVGTSTECTLTVSSLRIYLTSDTFQQMLFSVASKSTLNLNSVYIYGSSSYSTPSVTFQKVAIDASAGALHLKQTTFSYLFLSSQPLLSVSSSFAVESSYSDSSAFYRIYRLAGDGTLLSKTVSASDTFELTSSSTTNISYCRASEDSAGAMSFTVQGALSLSNIRFTSCYGSKSTGALSVTASGDGSVSLQTITFSGCYSSTTCGALSLTVSDSSLVTLQEITFSSCYCSTAAGALSLDLSGSGSVSLQDVQFTSCYAPVNGGAATITTEGNSKVTISQTIFDNCYTSSTSTEQRGGALSLNAAGGSVIIGYQSEDADPEDDYSVMFKKCHTAHGDGGAIYLNLTGGDVKIAQSADVSFNCCYTNNTQLRPAETSVVGNGGAMYIDISSGSLQIGGVTADESEDEDDIPTASFKGCYTPEHYTYGGAYFLRSTANSPEITFGKQSFSRVNDDDATTGKTGQGLYVYFTTNVAGYIMQDNRFADLLSSQDDWNKLDTFLAYDETTSTRYQMYAIGNAQYLTIYKDPSDSSSSPTDSWYCGVVTPCKTISAAVLNLNRFVLPTSTIRFDTDTFYVTGTDNITKDATIVGNEEKPEEAIMKISGSPEFNIYATVTFKDMGVSFVGDFSTRLFQIHSNGTLSINNVVFSCQQPYYYINDPLFSTYGGSSVSFTKTNFLSLRAYDNIFQLYDNNTNATGSVIFDGETTFDSIDLGSYYYIFQESLDDPESTLTIANGHFQDITAPRCFYIALTCGTIDIQQNTFERISSANGACVYLTVSGGVASLTDCTFTECASPYTGSGLYVSVSGGKATVSDCSFTSCTAQQNGGGAGFSLSNGSLALSNLAFDSCVADTNGGGAYLTVSDGALKLHSLKFTNCLAGGASCCNMSTSLSTRTNAEETVDQQINRGGYGGGMIMFVNALNSTHLSFEMDSISYTNNNASQGGTAVFVRTDDEDILDDKAWDSVIPKSKDAKEGEYTYVATSPQARFSQSSLNKKVHPGLSAGAIAGIVIACVAFVALIVVGILLFLFVIKPRMNKKQVDVASDNSGGTDQPQKEQEMQNQQNPDNTDGNEGEN